MLPQNQLGDEFRGSLVPNMLQDVDFFFEVLHSLFVALVSEVPVFPPTTILALGAADEAAQKPRTEVFGVSVPKFTALNDGAFEGLMCILSVVNGRFVFVALRRGRVDTTNQRVVELEFLVRSNYDAQE